MAFGADNSQQKVSSSDPLPITAGTLPLPSGAATEATTSDISTGVGDPTDAEAFADGSLIALTKMNRTHLEWVRAYLEFIASSTTIPGTAPQTFGMVVQGSDGTLARILRTDTSGRLLVQGVVGHGGDDAGNPLKVGGRADTTFQTAVSDGDIVDAVFDVYGAQFVRGDHPNRWSYHENSSSALTDAAVQSAPFGGFSIYVTDIILSNGSSTPLSVFFEEASTTILGPFYLEGVNGRSIHIRFQTPKKCTAATAITATTSAAVAHSLEVLGFIAP